MKALLTVSLALAFLATVKGGELEVYRDSNVVAHEIEPFLYPLLNVHESKVVSLTVAGATYKRVRGGAPFYLSLPEIQSIFFVTEGGQYKVTFHIVNLTNGKTQAIDGDGSGFGWQIGSALNANDRDRVDVHGPKSLVLYTHGGDWREIITLDLAESRIERVQSFDYNPHTGITGAERH